MKMLRILFIILALSVILILESNGQDAFQMLLPENAIGRIGRGQLTDIAYSPDGKLLAVGSSIGTWLYDANTGKEIALLTAHIGKVNSVAFSPDSKSLATVNNNYLIYLWDVIAREHKATLPGGARYITYSPDGKMLAGSSGTYITLWDIETRQQIRKIQGRSYSRILFSPDGKTLASSDVDDKLRIWDIETGKNIHALTMNATVDKSIAFSPDGRLIAGGSPKFTIRLWDPKTGKHVNTLSGHTDPVHSLVFTPDGKTLISGSGDKTIRIWDLKTGIEKIILTGHQWAVDSLAISPDSLTIASASFDGTIRFWDLQSGENKSTIRQAHHSHHATLSTDGSMLATDSNEDVIIWDTLTGKRKSLLTGFTDGLFSLSFSQDASVIFGNSKAERMIWETKTGKLMNKKTFGMDEMFSHIVPYENKKTYSPDGTTLAIRIKDGKIELWDTITRKRKLKLEKHANQVRAFTFSSDGSMLVIATNEEFEMWDTDAGKRIATYPKPGINPSVLAISKDGRMLAGGEREGRVNLWDINTGAHISSMGHHTEQTLKGISSLAFSTDGKTLASGSQDYTVRLWDTATGHHMQTLSGHPRKIWSSSGGITWLQFSPTNDTLFSRSEDGTIHLWDATHIVESDATVSISPSSIKSPAIGELLTLEVTIADADRINGYDITVEYDPTALRYVSSNKGDFVSENASYETKESRRMKVVDFHNVSYPHYLNIVLRDRDGRMEEGKSGRREDGREGRMEEGKVGKWEEDREGRMEDGKSERGEEDREGRMEGEKRGRLASITYEVIDVKTSTITLKDVRLELQDDIIARPKIIHGKVLDPNLTRRKPGDDTQLELPKGTIARYGKGRINDIKYSPDNSLLAISTTIGIWLHEANSGEILALLKGHTKATTVITFSPDGDLLASGSDDATIRLWDTTTYQSIRTLKTNGYVTGYVTAIAFSPNGNSLATGSGKRIQMWNVRTWQQIFTISQGNSTVADLVFSPDGTSLASASIDDSIKLWDAKTGQLKFNFDEERDGYMGGFSPRGPMVAFSPDGKRLASTAVDRNRFADKKIKIWDTQSGELQTTLEHERPGLTHPFATVQFSNDGKTVICCKSDGTLQHWNPKTDETVNPFGEAEYGKYTLLPISPNNRTFVRQTKDDNYELWDVETGDVITVLTGFEHAIPPLNGSTVDKETGVSKLQDKPTDLWKIISPQFTVPIHGIDNQITVPAVAFSPHSSTLVGKSSETVWLWDTNTSEQRSTFKIEYGDFIAHAFSPDGRVLAAVPRWEHTIRLWNVLTGEQELTLQGHAERITSITFSPDGAMIASAEVLNENEYVIRIWDAKTGNNLKTIANMMNVERGERLPVNAVAFSPDGETLASIDVNGEIHLWDVETGKHKATFTSFSLDIHHWVETSTLLFSPDGLQLISSIRDANIYVWDVKSRRHANTLKGHLSSVVSLAYSEEGTTLLSGSTDGTALKWQMQTTPTTRLAITPLSVESPPIGRKLTFYVKIIDAQNVTAYKFTCKYDSDALRYILPTQSSSLNTTTQVVETNTILVTGNASENSIINDGTIATLTFEIKEPENVTLTLTNVLLTHKDGKQTRPIETHAWVIKPELIPEDANRDWQVDAADLEFVSSRLGETGKGNSADINGDGIVDIADLVLVRKALYGSITEPNED